MSVAFDLILASTTVVVAYFVLARGDLFRSVVLFITFGVLLSLIWVRLNAFDLALVEVAIGAGITGALFLNTLGWMGRREDVEEGP
jgi:energy-converting hydrogenase B subunit D